MDDGRERRGKFQVDRRSRPSNSFAFRNSAILSKRRERRNCNWWVGWMVLVVCKFTPLKTLFLQLVS